MGGRLRIVAGITALLVAGLYPAQAQQAPAIDKTDNVKLVKQFSYEGGTELSAVGDFVFSGQLDGGAAYPSRGQNPDQGGMHIFNVAGKKPKEVGFLHCPGNDNDVEAVRPGLVLMGFHENKCAPSAGNGFMVINTSNPKNPRVVSSINTGKNHTFKPVPGTTLVYTAGGGLGPGNNHGPAIVDLKNPSKPEVVAQPKTITMDCHDISFRVADDGDRHLGFCAGAVGTGEVQIWDITDPLAPQTIGRIVNPAIQYSHYAVASPDGQLLAIDDEAFAAHECHTGQSPTGRVWIYDISNPELPVVQGSYAAKRGGDGTIGHYVGWIESWCLSHGLDWMPNSRNLAVTWFTGGWSVLNVDDPLNPAEVAHFQAEDSAAYSAYWHDGRLYTNDSRRGMDVFKISGLKKSKP